MDMKTMMTIAAAALLAACGSTEAPQARKAPGLQPDGSIHALVLAQGDSPGKYANVLLGVSRLEVSVDGRPVAVARASGTGVLDLARPGTSEVGVLDIPAGARDVELTVAFDRHGGFEFDGSPGGELQASTQVLTYSVPASYLSDRGHAVLHFDLERSLVIEGAGRVRFVPQLEVRF
jgi:hypothetical protein